MTKREKDLTIALLKEKIERLTGKKVVFKEGFSKGQIVFDSAKHKVLKAVEKFSQFGEIRKASGIEFDQNFGKALFELVKLGYVDKVEKGVYNITDAGKTALENSEKANIKVGMGDR